MQHQNKTQQTAEIKWNLLKNELESIKRELDSSNSARLDAAIKILDDYSQKNNDEFKKGIEDIKNDIKSIKDVLITDNKQLLHILAYAACNQRVLEIIFLLHLHDPNIPDNTLAYPTLMAIDSWRHTDFCPDKMTLQMRKKYCDTIRPFLKYQQTTLSSVLRRVLEHLGRSSKINDELISIVIGLFLEYKIELSGELDNGYSKEIFTYLKDKGATFSWDNVFNFTNLSPEAYRNISIEELLQELIQQGNFKSYQKDGLSLLEMLALGKNISPLHFNKNIYEQTLYIAKILLNAGMELSDIREYEKLENVLTKEEMEIEQIYKKKHSEQYMRFRSTLEIYIAYQNYILQTYTLMQAYTDHEQDSENHVQPLPIELVADIISQLSNLYFPVNDFICMNAEAKRKGIEILGFMMKRKFLRNPEHKDTFVEELNTQLKNHITQCDDSELNHLKRKYQLHNFSSEFDQACLGIKKEILDQLRTALQPDSKIDREKLQTLKKQLTMLNAKNDFNNLIQVTITKDNILLYLETDHQVLRFIDSQFIKIWLTELLREQSRVKELNFKQIKNIIALGKDRFNALESFGLHPLHNAAKKNQHELIEILLALKADVNQLDAESKTPLYFAIAYGNIKTLEILLENHAAPENIYKKAGVFFWAAFHGKQQILQFLFKRYPNIKDQPDYLDGLLNAAIKGGQVVLVKYLVENGAKTNNINKQKQTPLMVAQQKILALKTEKIKTRYMEIAQFLFEHHDHTPLINAVKQACQAYRDRPVSALQHGKTGQQRALNLLMIIGSGQNNLLAILEMLHAHLNRVETTMGFYAHRGNLDDHSFDTFLLKTIHADAVLMYYFFKNDNVEVNFDILKDKEMFRERVISALSAKISSYKDCDNHHSNTITMKGL